MIRNGVSILLGSTTLLLMTVFIDKLPVEKIRDVRWSSDTFDRRLVLKSTKKELIKALVTVHTSSSKPQKSDIIEGKGKGLILLFHGPPGTGKTLTAESIAEFAQRPLYRVTCGDIGTEPESVEKYLESVLYIGTVWRCVVLLDEADVFLEERTPTDLQRNALVSVFLRTLEYFEGILILTSNRVGTFDEAFKSRVQMAMHYQRLDRKERLEVWHMFFQDMLEVNERLKIEELHDKLAVLAQEDLNGRQIRNIINTARQLARYRNEVLAYTHIDQALEVAKEFEEYITRTRGHTDEEFAKSEGLR
jgi:SpoVK/Ycf46/Vps4 family AAA+-type ATPase